MLQFMHRNLQLAEGDSSAEEVAHLTPARLAAAKREAVQTAAA